MQTSIHPKYHNDTKVKCACGNTFETGSIEAEIEVDICNKCHPFFTGEMKFVDTQGRVEKFKAKQQKAQTSTGSKKKSKQEPQDETDDQPKTLREMLTEVRKNTKK